MVDYKALQAFTKDWTLENDTQSFALIESFAQNFLNKVDLVKSEFIKTEYNFRESQNDLNHLFCQFLNLSNNHFVENSVKAQEFTRNQEPQPLNKPPEIRSQEVVIELFKRALQIGISAVNLPQNANQMEESTIMESRGEAISIANFNYMGDKSHRLPFFYGTKQFFSTEFIGLAEKSVEVNENEFGSNEKPLINLEDQKESPKKEPAEKESPRKQSQPVKNENESPRKPTKNEKIEEKAIPKKEEKKEGASGVNPVTSDSQVAFLKGESGNNTSGLNVSKPQGGKEPEVKGLPPLPPPPPPPNLGVLLAANQPVKKVIAPPPLPPLPTVKNEEPKEVPLEPPKPLPQPPVNKPMDMMEEMRQKQLEMKRKKENPTDESLVQKKNSAPLQIAAHSIEKPPEKPVYKKSADEIFDKSENLVQSIAVYDITASATSKKDFSTITKKRMNIRDTQDLFGDEGKADEEDDDDPLFKNSTKRPLGQIFKPVDVSPVKEMSQNEEESPKKRPVLQSRPSLRNRDFESMVNEPALPTLNKNKANPKGAERLKGLLMDSDEEKSGDFGKPPERPSMGSGIKLMNLRKSHTKNLEEEENSLPLIDHNIQMDKPAITRKKKKAPTIFQDEDDEETKQEKPISLPKQKAVVVGPPELPRMEDSHVGGLGGMFGGTGFQKEKFEEEKSIVPLRMSNNHKSKKLGRLFDDDGDEDDFGMFSRPKPIGNLGRDKKKKLGFYDDEDE